MHANASHQIITVCSERNMVRGTVMARNPLNNNGDISDACSRVRHSLMWWVGELKRPIFGTHLAAWFIRFAITIQPAAHISTSTSKTMKCQKIVCIPEACAVRMHLLVWCWRRDKTATENMYPCSRARCAQRVNKFIQIWLPLLLPDYLLMFSVPKWGASDPSKLT